ncbi:MAG: bifunctional adenosylcobinamide kinase/adenosylcobinamide-phosphate guanylyltransferase [Lachnospiraceae bacterium]|nr:bifunctional adenosylcobinamide kinase/adenosylcobinamide-phosphate guanylyltransferase [Lachnospiraceae bacterium]
MEFIIGGSYQGKYEYALKRIREKNQIKGCEKKDGNSLTVLDGAICQDVIPETVQIWNHFHLYVKRMLYHGKSREDILEQVEKAYKYNPDLIIISDEIGYGIVPVDAEERRYREEVGRISCVLAQWADHVTRVICGLGTVIK